MFSCYDLAGKKITTAFYSDCNPSLDLTMTANEFISLKSVISTQFNNLSSSSQLDPVLILKTIVSGFIFVFPIMLLAWGGKKIVDFLFKVKV